MNAKAKRINDLVTSIHEKGRTGGFDELSEKQQVVFLIAELDIIAAMEGLGGFYYGVSGDQAIMAVAALEQVGLAESASLIRQANAIFPGGRPPSSQADLETVLNNLDFATYCAINAIGYRFLEHSDGFQSKIEEFILANIDQLSQGL